MKISFLGQGFEDKSVNAVGNHLVNFLGLTGFDSFTGISAFASESGVYGLSGYLNAAKKNFKNLNLIVGVDLEGTSKEALEEILALNINSYIFYQQEQPIFHPKIFLIEGTKETKIIIGSSNLTRGGLFTNVESSMLIEFDLNDKEGLALLSELKGYYKSLFDFSDPNLLKISTSVIADLFSKGIIPDETARRSNYVKKSTGTSSASSTSTSTVVIQKRTTAKVPSTFPSKPRTAGPRNVTTSSQTTTVQPAIITPAVQQPQPRVLVWQKLSLSNSDAQNVPSGTAITGNLKLSQARFRVNNITIDQTTYFRNQVFNNLTWVNTKANNNSYEEAFCPFDVTLLGNPIGTFTLKLSHDPVRIAGQGNTPTWLHWGNAILPFLQQTNITGRTLNLYQTNQSFSIEIV